MKLIVHALASGSVAFFALHSNLSYADDAAQKAVIRAKEIMYSIVDKSSYVVSFHANGSTVDESAKTSLKALFKNLEKELNTGEVVIAGWSDKQFPSDSSVKLAQADQDLAQRRVQHVTEYVKTLNSDVPIVPMNMAEQSNLISRFFNSNEKQIKEAMQSGDTDSRKVAAIAKLLKDKGGPGKVVVLVRKAQEIPNS